MVLVRQPGQLSNALITAGVATVITFGVLSHYLLTDLAPLGWLLNGMNPALAVLLLLRFPESRIAWWRAAFAGLCACVLFIIRLGLLVTTRTSGVRWPANVPWPGRPEDAADYQRWMVVRVVAYAVLALAFAALFLHRWIHLGGLERRILRPLLWTVLVTAATFAATLAEIAVPAGAQAATTVRLYAPAALAAAFLIAALRARLAKGALSVLIAEVSGAVTLSSVRSALRKALSDDTLDVFYWIPARHSYVDTDGRDTARPTPAPDRWVRDTHTPDGRELVAAVSMDARLHRQQELVDSAITISRLALQNARLQADLQAQLAAANDARRRLLHSGLEQRRQLERDLHDGAQARLLSLSLRVGKLKYLADHDDAGEFESIQVELRAALAELRELAHGLYPAILSQSGLNAAVQALTDRMPATVDVDIPRQRWDPDLESAAYLIISEGLTNILKHAGPCAAAVLVTENGPQLRVQVTDNGHGQTDLNRPTSLAGLRDRVVALGGTLQIDSSPDHGTKITAQLPHHIAPDSEAVPANIHATGDVAPPDRTGDD
ncbi:MAG TPA: ATP-binding protein [Microlunatus sp.]